jgi:uncharacterized protein with HEPN domain
LSADADTRRLLYLRDTITAIEERARMGREAVLGDPVERDALLWRLDTLADAAHELPTELKAGHTEIPWERIRGFRNIAAHGYLPIALDAAWDIVENHLAALTAVAVEELGERGHQAGPS